MIRLPLVKVLEEDVIKMTSTYGVTTSLPGTSSSSSSSSSTIYPLPFVSLPHRCNSVSPRIRQRYYRMRLVSQLVNCTISALNRLYSPLYYTTFSVQQFETASSSKIHHRILIYIKSCILSFLSESRGHSTSDINSSSSSSSLPLSLITDYITSLLLPTDSSTSSSYINRAVTINAPVSGTSLFSSLPSPSPSSSLFSSYASTSSYFHSLPVNITPLIAAKVSIPSTTASVDMLTVLPSLWSSMYSSSTSGLLKPPQQADHDLSRLHLPAPRVHGSNKQYVALVNRLISNEMIDISLSSHIKVVNGLFTVTKDEHTTRLIIDARYANAHFIDPPSVHLPTPSSFISLSLPTGATLYKAKTDIENFYHNIKLPSWLCSYFALPAIRIDQLPHHYVSSSSLLSTLSPSTRVHPVLTRLAMGFSHAVSIAQTIHEHVLYTSKVLSPTSHILNLSSPVISSDVIHAPYVDDNNLISTDRYQLQQTYDRCLIAYAAAGFPVKQSKLVTPTADPVTMIGVSISSTGIVTLPIDRVHMMLISTMAILTAGHCTGKLMASIVGSWTWCMLLRRFSLCTFRHVYRFIQCAGDDDYTLWPSVVLELSSIIALSSLLRADMSSSFFPKVIATDASTTGGGISATSINDMLFTHLFPITSHHVQDLTCVTISDQEQQSTVTAISRSSSSVAMQLHQPHIDTSDVISICNRAVSAYSTISNTRWYDIVSFPWSRIEHINALELNVVHTAIRWVLSHPHSISMRTLLCIDNAASYYALRKGRSTKMLTTLRKIAALMLSTGLVLSLLWVPSKVNPADKASRVYDYT
jgi:hypothetical protein